MSDIHSTFDRMEFIMLRFLIFERVYEQLQEMKMSMVTGATPEVLRRGEALQIEVRGTKVQDRGDDQKQ